MPLLTVHASVSIQHFRMAKQMITLTFDWLRGDMKVWQNDRHAAR